VLENERLQADLRARLTEVAGSRARLVEDAEQLLTLVEAGAQLRDHATCV